MTRNPFFAFALAASAALFGGHSKSFELVRNSMTLEPGGQINFGGNWAPRGNHHSGGATKYRKWKKARAAGRTPRSRR